jgi:hypothetical protein
MNRSLSASVNSDCTVPSVSQASSRSCLLVSLLKNPAIYTRPARDTSSAAVKRSTVAVDRFAVHPHVPPGTATASA